MNSAGRPRYGFAISVALGFGLLALLPILLLIGFGAPGLSSFVWEALMMVGFVAVGGLVLLPITTGRWARILRRSPLAVQTGYDWHEGISYVLVALVLVHAVGALVAQPTTIQYIKLSAPIYMLCGMASTIGFCALLIHARRLRARPVNHGWWRHMHAGLSIASIALALYHVAGSGYYFNTPVSLVALVLFGVVPTLLALTVDPNRWASRVAGDASVPIRIARVGVAVTLFWVVAIVGVGYGRAS